MLKAILSAAVVIGVAGAATQARAANSFADVPSLANIHNQPLQAQQVYWTRDIYGRPVWVPGRPYPPPYWRHRRWWDGRHWRWR